MMEQTRPDSAAPVGLSQVARLPLWPEHAEALDRLAADALGRPVWKQRKLAEAHGLLALAQIAPRLVVRQLDLRTDLMAVVELRETPVPCRPPGEQDIRLAPAALLGIRVPEQILVGPLPGMLPVRVLAPRHVFHSNVAFGVPAPPLCLGANVPRGFPARELVLTAYGALTLQSISLDALDPAGVLNPIAAGWYQTHADRVPLTTAPFLAALTPTDAGSDRDSSFEPARQTAPARPAEHADSEVEPS